MLQRKLNLLNTDSFTAVTHILNLIIVMNITDNFSSFVALMFGAVVFCNLHSFHILTQHYDRFEIYNPSVTLQNNVVIVGCFINFHLLTYSHLHKRLTDF
jgi:hypothetical protein